MDIIQNLEDFIETGGQLDLANCLKGKLKTNICAVKIKNKEFMIKHLEPNHDFIIHTTSVACCEPKRLLA